MANKYGIQYVSFYTQGSSAKKIAPVRQAPKVILPEPKKRKRRVIYVDPVAILSLVVAVSLFIMMTVGLCVLHQEQMQTSRMEQYADRLQAENVALTDDFNAKFDPVEVEQTALALGMKPQSQVPQTVIYVPAQPQQQEPAQTSTFLTYMGLFVAELFA